LSTTTFPDVAKCLSFKGRGCVIACLLVILCGETYGQVIVTNQFDGHTPGGLTAGTPTGSYPLSDFENVNPYNGALNFHFPLLNIGGRGSAGYTMMLPIEQKWRVDHYVWPPPNPSCSQCPWQNEQTNPVDYHIPVLGSGAMITPGYSAGVFELRRSGEGYKPCGSDTVYFETTLTRLTFTAADGTQIEFRDAKTDGHPQSTPYTQCWNGFNREKVFVSGDGSAATFISDIDITDYTVAGDTTGGYLPTGYLLMADGSTYRVVDGFITSMRDRNGNTVNGTTDSLGRSVTITPANQTTPFVQISYSGFNGEPRTIKVWYGSLHDLLRNTQPTDSATPMTFWQLFGSLTLPQGMGSNPVDIDGLVSKIEMPDGDRKSVV